MAGGKGGLEVEGEREDNGDMVFGGGRRCRSREYGLIGRKLENLRLRSDLSTLGDRV